MWNIVMDNNVTKDVINILLEFDNELKNNCIIFEKSKNISIPFD